MNIQHHRPMKPGPEAKMMDAVYEWSQHFVASGPCWRASSIPIGAGIPDFIFATYRPEISKLTTTGEHHAGVLSYLRFVRTATSETIAERTARPVRRISEALSNLVEAEAVEQNGNAFRLTSRWRQILPKIIAVEAKVTNWRKAVEQASRNAIFVHYSYVAFPERLSDKVSENPIFEQLGVGVMGIGDSGELRIVRRALRSKPIAWYYYYDLALKLSRTDARRECPSKSESTTPENISPLILS